MQSKKTKRKVFVSLLGTGFYNKCVYRYEKTALETRFIQHATLKMFGDGFWDKDRDKVIIFLTDEARKSNWDRSITTREIKDGSVVPYDSLETVLVNAGYEDMLITKSIPDGRTDEEMWEIFDAIYEELQDGDELYVDVTHAFRYLPMLMLVLINYSRFLKNTEIMSVSYGNYEARVKIKNSDGVEEAPIMQLLPIVELMDWTLAASDFIKNGRAENLLSITIEKTKAVTKDNASSEALKKYYGRMEGIVKTLSKYAEAIRMSNGKFVFKGLASTKCEVTSSLDNYRYRALLPIVSKVIEEYKEKFTVGDKADSKAVDMKLILRISQWCLDKKLYQQFATLLREGIISYYCSACLTNAGDIKSFRDRISRYLSVRMMSLHNGSGENYEFVKDMNKQYPKLKDLDDLLGDEFYNKFNKLTEWRNYLNHAWTSKTNVQDSSLAEDFHTILKTFEVVFPDKTSSSAIEKEKVFINFSNHPYADWSDAQKGAFADFGEVKEVPFPPIGPDWSSEKINEEADKYCMQIFSISEDKDVTVHIMGEMTFCFAVVSRLKEAGIRCVASCSERNVTVEGGKKISQFDFVGYREY